MSSENVYLPGKIRDRIQDLMKSRKVTQAELATRIGVSESSLSRFISGKDGQTGGLVEWKNKDGKTLDEMYRK